MGVHRSRRERVDQHKPSPWSRAVKCTRKTQRRRPRADAIRAVRIGYKYAKRSMAEQQTRIMETQSDISLNIKKLEAYIGQNNEKIDTLTRKNTGADMKNEILRIKTAVNENATVLQGLFQTIQQTHR